MKNDVRVRFAPSNTGFLHVGGVRTALFNWLFARQHGGSFILRIEDTDLERSEERFTGEILNSLRWLGLTWDEGPEVGGPHEPYFQSQRLPTYQQACDKLLEGGHAYYSFAEAKGTAAKDADFQRKARATKQVYREGPGLYGDTPEAEAKARLAEGEVPAIRFRSRGDAGFQDLIRGHVNGNGDEIDDFVIMKSQLVDGQRMPTYNFAATVDDIAMGITHVLRGDDHISNTSRQVLLYRALGATLPEFGHLSMILGPDKTRLSKRHGAVSTSWFADEGYVPEALVNFLALLGWSYDDRTEYFTVDELIKHFSLERVNKSAAVFDYEKLYAMNSTYVKDFPLEKKVAQCLPVLQKEGFMPEELSPEQKAYVGHLVEAIGDRLHLLTDVVRYGRFLFIDTLEFDEKAYRKHVRKEAGQKVLREVREVIAGTPDFTAEALEAAIKDYGEKTETKPGKIYQPLRVALTGTAVSFGIFDILVLLGQERCLQRLDAVIEAPAG